MIFGHRLEYISRGKDSDASLEGKPPVSPKKEIRWSLVSVMSATSPGELWLWTPQLRPFAQDAALWMQNPIKADFGARLISLTTRTNDWSMLRAELCSPYWVRFSNVQNSQLTLGLQDEFAADWLAYCLGGELVGLMRDEILAQSWNIILDVLYIRFTHLGGKEGEDLAEKSLLTAQMDTVHNFRSYVRCYHYPLQCFINVLEQPQAPADFCWLEDLERRDTWMEDSDAGERLSDWEDNPQDTDFVYVDDDDDEDDPMQGTASDNDEDEEYLPNFLQSSAPPCPAALPQKRGKKKRAAPSGDLTLLPAVWRRHINVFFFTKVNPVRAHVRYTYHWTHPV